MAADSDNSEVDEPSSAAGNGSASVEGMLR